LDGQDVLISPKPNFKKWRRKVTMVFQSALYSIRLVCAKTSVIRSMDTRPDGIRRERVHHEAGTRLEGGRKVLDKIPSELSTGMKASTWQLARALAQNPEAILYDEPTTMVDPIHATQWATLFLRLKGKVSIARRSL